MEFGKKIKSKANGVKEVLKQNPVK
jgi:hypothetical protein